MNILLINLPNRQHAEDYTTPNHYWEHFIRYPPLGLMALVPALDRSHQADILDLAVRQTTLEEAITLIAARRPDVLGISVMTRFLYPLVTIARGVRARLPHVRIVVGGPHATRFPRETLALRVADYVLPGYAEFTFSALVQVLSRGGDDTALTGIHGLHWHDAHGMPRHNAAAAVPTVLDELPFPDRTLLDPRDYYTAAERSHTTTVYSSRGCPFHCIFCDVVDKQFRFRSPANLVDEFSAIVARGIRSIFVFDDTFNLDRERVLAICREIRRRQLSLRWSVRCRIAPFDREMAQALAGAGCFRLHVGVETLDAQLLRQIRKGITREQIESFFRLCREFRLETMAYFVVGLPGETAEYRRHLRDEIRRLDPTYFFINVLFPQPETAYYRSLLADGTYTRDHWAAFIASPVPNFRLPLPRSPDEHAELMRLAEELTSRHYLSPRFILRELCRDWRSPRAIIFKARLALLLCRIRLLPRKRR